MDFHRAHNQHTRPLSDEELKATIQMNLRQMIENGLGMAFGVRVAFFTYGIGITGTTYSAYKLCVAKRMHTILMEEWCRRRLGHISVRLRKRDLLLFCVAGIVTSIFPQTVEGDLKVLLHVC
ncbi:hypothetical protein FRB94_004363 [Tulasnella sp. JGI-2019a]|nr:hypothetical protein FRB94_004363 [Tulasnella sp. JGI-2019a]KAG9035272.1 hypothetical protein FRB95_011567 [Tulasnella sp. JGI-2019a]